MIRFELKSEEGELPVIFIQLNQYIIKFEFYEKSLFSSS